MKQKLINKFIKMCDGKAIEYKDLVEDANNEQLLKYLMDDVPCYDSKNDLVKIALYQIDRDLHCSGDETEIIKLIDSVYTEAELEEITGGIDDV